MYKILVSTKVVGFNPYSIVTAYNIYSKNGKGIATCRTNKMAQKIVKALEHLDLHLKEED